MRMSMGLRMGSSGTAGGLLGAELVSNGTFDTNTTGWTDNAAATISVVSGDLRVEHATGSGTAYAYQAVTVVAGQRYRVSLEMVDESETPGLVRCGDSIAASDYINGATVGIHTDDITPTGTTIYLTALITTAASIGDGALFDNFSVRKII